jgi:transcriptional regulator with XRE-family HTH domain
MVSSAQRSSRKQRERTILLDLLRELRMQKGLSQDQMAKAIGTKQAFVSKYETGEGRLDFLDLVARSGTQLSKKMRRLALVPTLLLKSKPWTPASARNCPTS